MKAITLFVLTVLLLSMTPFALAQEDLVTDAEGVDAGVEEIAIEGDGGIAPDSFLYGLDVALDNLTLFLTFDRMEKARKGLEIAKERLLEARAMARQRKLAAMDTAINEHARSIETAEDAVAGFEDNTTSERARLAASRLAEIRNRIEAHEEEVAAVDDSITEDLEDEVSEAELSEIRAKIEKIKEKAKELRGKAAEKRASIKLKLRAHTEATEEEAEAEIGDIEKTTDLDEDRLERVKRAKSRAKRILHRARERLRAEQVSDLDREIQDSEDVLDDTDDLDEQKDHDKISDSAEELRRHGHRMRAIAHSLREAKEEGTFEERKKELITEARSHHITVLESILSRLPDDLKPRLEERIEAERQKIEEMHQLVRETGDRETGDRETGETEDGTGTEEEDETEAEEEHGAEESAPSTAADTRVAQAVTADVLNQNPERTAADGLSSNASED